MGVDSRESVHNVALLVHGDEDEKIRQARFFAIRQFHDSRMFVNGVHSTSVDDEKFEEPDGSCNVLCKVKSDNHSQLTNMRES